jgi:hypothetical protein
VSGGIPGGWRAERRGIIAVAKEALRGNVLCRRSQICGLRCQARGKVRQLGTAAALESRIRHPAALGGKKVAKAQDHWAAAVCDTMLAIFHLQSKTPGSTRASGYVYN